MPAKRRRTMDRSPINRFRLWDAKLNPSVIAQILSSVKDVARERMLQYQVTHEYIIEQVKNVLAKYGSEAFRAQEYIWYAQGLWYCATHYRGPALQRMADAHYIYYRCLGLNPGALREIAKLFGITINADEVIIQQYLNIVVAGITAEQVYQGTKQALEEVVKPYLKKPDIAMDKVAIEIEYDTDKNIKTMKITDKATGETTTITFEYDTEGFLKRIDET